MRIEAWRPGAVAASPSGSARAAPRPSFRLGPDEAATAGAARAAAPLATLDAILMLQAEDDGAERRRRSARRGTDLLAALDELRAALLSGSFGPEVIRRLAASLATGVEASGDPVLDEVVGAIELRAKVEVAKLGQRTRPG